MRAAFALLLLAFVLPSPASGGEGLRVVSYNVWYGFTKVPERKGDTLKWMAAQKPDIVSLQELNGYTADQLKADAKAWGHDHSALLKENGFPTGITSRFPIEDLKRMQEGFHHGLLRARIQGIYFYVIHLHPSNWETRLRETKLILADIDKLPKGSKVCLAGDFNTFSEVDREYYAHGKLEPFFAARDAKYREKNLREGKLDYSVIAKFSEAGLVDLDHAKRGDEFRFTGSFPTKIEKAGEHGQARRLDYVFATRNLVSAATRAEVIADETTWKLSDHLPVIVDFVFRP